MSEDHPILQLIRRRSTRGHFDPDRVLDTQQIRELVRDASEFGIEDRYVPVLLLAVGYPCGSESPRMPRLDVSQVLAFDHGPIPG